MPDCCVGFLKIEVSVFYVNYFNLLLSFCQFQKNLFSGMVSGVLVLKKKLYGAFLWMGSTASRLEPLRGGSLLFTTKYPEVPGTHFIDLGRMKG